MTEITGTLSPNQAARLRVVDGGLDDMETLVDVLFPKVLEGEPVHVIIYGIGGFRTQWITDNTSNTQGVMANSYISEEAVFTVIAALLAGFQKLGSRERPRIVSIGTISITRQIYQSCNPLAVKARPLYEWFMGKQEDSDPSQRNPIHRDNISSDTSSDTSSEHTITQLNYDRSCRSENDETSSYYESSDDSSTSSGAQTDTEASEAESTSSMEVRSANADKSAMEEAIRHHYPCFSSSLIVRPTLLTYDRPYGL
ncbi:hypothetical protein CGRA01v4_11412 [Colletotrichum graminicola]|nr:hypothetical protein CGRA01v4_11412 [Colletotrichum graminicola]